MHTCINEVCCVDECGNVRTVVLRQCFALSLHREHSSARVDWACVDVVMKVVVVMKVSGHD